LEYIAPNLPSRQLREATCICIFDDQNRAVNHRTEYKFFQVPEMNSVQRIIRNDNANKNNALALIFDKNP
jgi:hypothetical protein